MLQRIAPILLLPLLAGGCAQYQLAMQDVEIPSYEPRVVLVPATCEALIQRAATDGMTGFSEAQSREVLFCQQQMIIRTQEEEAAAKRLESHAAAAGVALATGPSLNKGPGARRAGGV